MGGIPTKGIGWSNESNLLHYIIKQLEKLIGRTSERFATNAEKITSSEQSVTDSWENVGDEIDCRGYTRLCAWIILVHNDSTNNSIKALAKHKSGGDEYELPLKTVDSSLVTVLTHSYELDDDASQSVILDWDVKGIPFVQLQIKCDTIGDVADTMVIHVTKM